MHFWMLCNVWPKSAGQPLFSTELLFLEPPEILKYVDIGIHRFVPHGGSKHEQNLIYFPMKKFLGNNRFCHVQCINGYSLATFFTRENCRWVRLSTCRTVSWGTFDWAVLILRAGFLLCARAATTGFHHRNCTTMNASMAIQGLSGTEHLRTEKQNQIKPQGNSQKHRMKTRIHIQWRLT